MHVFLDDNREELIERCRAKVALRLRRTASPIQLAKGVPLFLDQLIRTLQAEDEGDSESSVDISGASGGDTMALSEIGVSAAAHGKLLLDLGYTLEQVVHDYGDLCQAITDLAVERGAPFAIDEFRTLNRCLDNAIADAAASFASQRDLTVALKYSADENQRLGFLVHELRNSLQTATAAFSALEAGRLAIGGSTSGLVKRSLASMGDLLTDSISVVRNHAQQTKKERLSLVLLVNDARVASSAYASTGGCTLRVSEVDPSLMVDGDRVRLAAALVNLLQNAFKFSHADSDVQLRAYGRDDRVFIEVEDRCGGLPPGAAENLFEPFRQAGRDRSGLGLGVSIARQSVQADGGSLSVRDLPRSGCIFTIELPRAAA